ncbi:MAG TPA: MgtC/SapB family protein [Thermomicrobiales bacterium]|nr:MgtC/SapB family protein [Thermomicrobiales bacterium]
MVAPGEIAARLLAALLFCGTIGLQRQWRGKAAGIRTHILVGVGAALFTLISAATEANNARITAQVVTGIGFIGGGAILKEHGSIKGLTTAAGLWATAALGMAAGTGYYAMGAIATALVLATLAVIGWLERRLPRGVLTPWSLRVALAPGAQPDALRAVLARHCQSVALDALTWDAELGLTFVVELRPRADLPALTAQLQAAGARSVSWQAAIGAEEWH